MDKLYESLSQLLPLLVIVAGIYFIALRPQQQRLKSHQDLLSKLKKGDHVVTAGGLIGTIDLVHEDTLSLIVARGVTVTVRKNQVIEILPYNQVFVEIDSQAADLEKTSIKEVLAQAPSVENPMGEKLSPQETPPKAPATKSASLVTKSAAKKKAPAQKPANKNRKS